MSRGDWSMIDLRLCPAIVDRLIFGGNIETDSYHLAQTHARQAATSSHRLTARRRRLHIYHDDLLQPVRVQVR
jgi:hypothetical protein